jgi:O-antigen/teichoic acid export membrane protein
MALHYSRLLGPENRGILSFVVLLMMTLSEIILGPLNLEMRSTHDKNLLRQRTRLFLFSSVKRILGIALIISILEVFFSTQKFNFPPKLFAISISYIFFALLAQQLLELIIAFSKIEFSSVLEFSIVALQMLIYIVLLSLTAISTIVVVLLSLMSSYIAVIFALIFIYSRKFSVLGLSDADSDSFLKYSRTFIPQVLSVSLLDRLDKVLFFLLFSISDFGKYMAASSLFLVFRFFPETVGKLVLNRRLARLSDYVRKNIKLISIALGLSLFPLAVLGSWIISIVLGKNWVLPFSIYVLLMACEIARFFMIIEINRRNILRNHIFTFWSPVVIALFITLSSVVLRPILGIQTVPVVMFISFSLILGFLGRELKSKPSRPG